MTKLYISSSSPLGRIEVCKMRSGPHLKFQGLRPLSQSNVFRLAVSLIFHVCTCRYGVFAVCGSDGMEPVLTYFDATYVTGTYRAIRRVTTVQTPRRLHFRRCPPLVPIQTWNVFDALLNNQART